MLQIFLVLLLTCPLPAFAQIIRGTISDATAKASINGVAVTLLGRDDRTLSMVISDDKGQFELALPNGRPVRVRAERIGYETVTSGELIAHGGEVLEIHVQMSQHAVELEGITIVARRQIDERLRDFAARVAKYQRAGIGRIWTRAYFEQYRPALVSHFVRAVPSRPGGLCTGATYYVDNVRLGVGEDDATLEDFDLVVSSNDLEGIEVYRDTDAPPEVYPYMKRLDGTSYCIAVFVWRKPYSELYARSGIGRTRKWRVLVAVGLLAGLIVAEQALW